MFPQHVFCHPTVGNVDISGAPNFLLLDENWSNINNCNMRFTTDGGKSAKYAPVKHIFDIC